MGTIKYLSPVLRIYCIKNDNGYYVEQCTKEDIDPSIIYRTRIRKKAEGICNYMNNATNPLLTKAIRNWRAWL